MDDRRRFFVLTFGRSGSSMLCALLADAGADFGMPVPPAWDLRRGAMEDPQIKLAARHMLRALEIESGGHHLLSPSLEAGWHRRRARRAVRQSLGTVRFVKSNDLDLIVPIAYAEGYEPRIIISYREFESSLASALSGRRMRSPEALAEEYLRVYRQGLAFMQTFGGCSVGFSQLGQPEQAWLAALAGVTGLPLPALQQAAAVRVNSEEVSSPAPPVIYPACHALLAQLEESAGQICEPRIPARRSS